MAAGKADKHDPSPQPEQLLGHLLNRLALLTREQTYSALQPFGLAPRSLGMLLCLADAPGVSQRTLGRRLGLDRTTIGQLAEDLESDGWIVREIDPGDRRNFQLHLTEPGNERLPEVAATARAVQTEILSALADQRAQQLLDDLRLVLDSLRSRRDVEAR